MRSCLRPASRVAVAVTRLISRQPARLTARWQQRTERLFTTNRKDGTGKVQTTQTTQTTQTRRGPRRVLLTAAGVGTLGAIIYVCWGDDDAAARAARGLNTESFVPFSVVGREPVAADAVVLTLRLAPDATPAAHQRTQTALAAAWRRDGTWAVEAKQPQLQIAREYTPLPWINRNDDDDNDDGTTVRLFVRVVPGGEMSRYLASRAVGDTVSLRGPRNGFAVVPRLGADGRLVFLAAGTGIAPALQAAVAVLQSSEANGTVTLLWANRTRQADDNPLVRDLQALQRRFGERLQMQCFADADRTGITAGAVQECLQGHQGGQSWWPWSRAEEAAVLPTPAPATDCVYHAAALLEWLAADSDDTTCTCARPSSRDVVMVSGPAGFVSFWAGPKRWSGGLERQGPVGGVLGTCTGDDQLVVKL